MRKIANFELGAQQKRAYLVDLENTAKYIQLQKLALRDYPQRQNILFNFSICSQLILNTSAKKKGFDTEESGPSKVWVTGMPVYRYTRKGTAPTGIYPELRSEERALSVAASLILAA